tara:strand:- start:2424 stop:2546 length:123 start_codon:yes stop_codon:yes gene_type:complete
MGCKYKKVFSIKAWLSFLIFISKPSVKQLFMSVLAEKYGK